MKTLWILNHYAQEPGSSGGTRHYDLAENLKAHGWAAYIIAASTEHNTGRQRLADTEASRLDIANGVPFLWLKTPTHSGNGADRLLNMLTYSVRALVKSSTRQLPPPDALIGSSVHPFAALSGALLARRHHVPFLFEVRDLWPETLISMGRLKPNSPIAFAMRWLEAWLYRRADKIIVLLPDAHDYIRQFGIPESKTVWIPNGIELNRFLEPAPPEKSDTFTLMFFGAHGTANGLDNVIKAFLELNTRALKVPIKLRLIGDGPEKPALRELARGAPNISFESPVPKSQIPSLAHEADAFIFNLIDAPVFRYGISPNKLYDFMAAARPVIFACSAPNNPISASDGGLTVPAGDPVALADAIERLSTMQEQERAAMGQAARSHVVHNHGFDQLAARLARVLDDLD